MQTGGGARRRRRESSHLVICSGLPARACAAGLPGCRARPGHDTHGPCSHGPAALPRTTHSHPLPPTHSTPPLPVPLGTSDLPSTNLVALGHRSHAISARGLDPADLSTTFTGQADSTPQGHTLNAQSAESGHLCRICTSLPLVTKSPIHLSTLCLSARSATPHACSLALAEKVEMNTRLRCNPPTDACSAQCSNQIN